MWDRLKRWARQLKAETLALWFCCRHSATPLAAKIAATLVVAYALSPIDLIPDFIPVLGYLDDVILVPLGIYLVLKLVPKPVIDECRAQARAWIAARQPQPRNYVAAALMVGVWIALLWAGWSWFSGPAGPR